MKQAVLSINWKKLFVGNENKNGIGSLAFNYIFLVGIGFLFIYPFIYMVINSFMPPEDLTDPTIAWIPTSFYLGNFTKAINTLKFVPAFVNSLMMSVIPSLLVTISSCCMGYGLARFEFPLKKMWIILVVAMFFVPGQVTLIPRYMMFNSYLMIDTFWPSFLPAMFGQGIKGAIFVLIFFQFFSSYPKALDEAAAIDGSGRFKTFYLIAVPMAKSAIVVSILFSLVWYWNETATSGLFFGSVIKTLPMQLANFASMYANLYGGSSGGNSGIAITNAINESISLAGTFMSILPLLVLYLILQKQFVESIEKAGITGE